MVNRDIQLLNTRDSVYSIAVNGILLHSMYHPLKEACNFAKYREDSIKNKRHIVIYGAGLGYHIVELLKLIDKKSTVDLFDIDDEIVEVSKKYGVLNEILKDKRVKFFHSYSEKTMKNLSLKINSSDEFIIFKPSVRVLKEEHIKFKEAINRFEIGIIEIERHGKIAKENFILNSKVSCHTIEEFFKVYSVKDKKVVIAAAGPSLGLKIDKLKKIREKVIIFAVGSALGTLMKAGIKPDIITIIDPQEIVYNQIKGYENLDIPLCFLSTASNLTVTKYNGPKFIFYNSENHRKSMIIETGKSVATAALSIAINGKANAIIFLGQDLAYINNKSHCDDYVHGNYMIDSEGIFQKVKGVDGSLLNTTEGWLYFKNWIEKKIAQNPQIKFINSSVGARISGTIEMDLDKIFKN
ncbi:MAG: DUF115 domain-containing protein [Clostridium sp.]|nr:DUF115 domain-containing protein [Clostridium sp.]